MSRSSAANGIAWRRVSPVVLAVVLGLCLSTATCTRSTSPASPNILLIMLDDLGYNDLGIYASDAPTPHIDALAREGILYDRHYAQPSCSVARAALLTGTYPSRHGFRPTHLGLSSDTPTIASLLREAGYTTQHIGKWHVGNPTLAQSPLSLGFDAWFGFLFQQELGGLSKDGIRYPGPRYNNPWLYDNAASPRQYDGHLTDIITARASQFIAGQSGSATPWFLNLWYFAPHAPVQPAARFRQRYPATAEGEYLALLDQLDDSVGQVLATLEHSGQADNTLIIVLSDNGGAAKLRDSNYPFIGRKTQLAEGGLRTPLLMRWPGRFVAGTVSNDMVSLFDILPTILSAAGTSSPAHVIGRNLLATPLAESPQLIWESADSRNYNFSLLSRDGRWRYSNGSWSPERLHDLHADPSGATDVLDQHPQVVAALREDYRQWRLGQRVVDVAYEPLNDRGGARLTGRELLRSPGYRGFTFALGVTPEALTGEAQMIVAQRDRWSLRTSARAAALDFQGETMFLPPLPEGRCTEVVVTAYFLYSPILPDTNWSSIEVYYNGQRVGQFASDELPLDAAGYMEPTFVGMAVPGRAEFSGTLTRPLILNERVLETASGPLMHDSLGDIPSSCPIQDQ